MDIEQFGAGPDLVVLHSLLTDRTAFHPIARTLSQTRRVTLINLPGYGKTPPTGDGIEKVAQMVSDGLPEWGIPTGYDLLGNGYGGFVALSMAQHFGNRISHLMLVDSAAGFEPAGKDALRTLKSVVEKNGMGAVIDAAVSRLFPQNFILQSPEVVAEVRTVLSSLDPLSFAGICQNLIDANLHGGLAKVRNRTLIVVGDEDTATPPVLARQLADGIAGATLVVIPGCGHAPHMQAPAKLVAILEKFLADRQERRRAGHGEIARPLG